MAPSARDVWNYSKENIIPDLFTKRRFNFITVHYLYILGWTILGSVLLFAIGGIPYIDCFFFASGAATQSGLNTVDVDKIHTGQQFVLYLMAMFCNPIVINSFVVFIRLYWFEKRFKDIVRDARHLRKTKSKSKYNTIPKDDLEKGKVQNGVRGRAIQVLRDTGHLTDKEAQDEQAKLEAKTDSVTSSDNSKTEHGDGSDEAGQPTPEESGRPNLHPVQSPDEVRVPSQFSKEQTIAFLENQRNPKDTSTLRIPSPREFDRGGTVQDIANEEKATLQRSNTTGPSERRRHINFNLGPRNDDAQDSHHITIDEPNFMRSREKTSTFPRLNTRQSTNRSLEGEDALSPTNVRRRNRSGTFNSFRRSNTEQARALGQTPYLDFQPTIGRNSLFVDLTEEEREKLGGIEYRALKTLALVFIFYFTMWHAIGVICLVPWILKTPSFGKYVVDQGQGRVWWGIFTAGSAFNDLGFTLTNNSMISFGTAAFPMLLMTFLIVIGNTGFPCMLRFTIWMTSKLVPIGSGVWEELMFLLDHPRRCFTLLFPGSATWWLFTVLIVLNGLDLLFFIVLDLHDSTVSTIPGGYRFLDGLFQASSTRTAGFSVVNLANLHPAIQVSYLIMMYISVFPIAISMRRTNVYEEKSLGIYGSKADVEADEKEPNYIGAHVRKQLGFDLWYIFVALFIIAIVEGNRLENTNEYAFTIFSVLFEIVSAYGTVGMSLGYPTINASFSAEFATVSKLVIIAMQIRGRHRGLPYELDRAILLPSESLHEKEKREGEKHIARRRSSLGGVSDTSAVGGTVANQNFRRETGLSSGVNSSNTSEAARSRGNTGQTDGGGESKVAHAATHLSEHHHKHVRSGLGNAMFRLAAHAEVGEKDSEDEK